MGEVQLIATFHEEAQGSISLKGMDDTCERVFARKIIPQMTDDTILVCEGSFLPGVIRPHHRLYSELSGLVSPSLGTSSRNPSLFFADERFIKYSPIFLSSYATMINIIGEYYTKSIYISGYPRSLDELLCFLQEQTYTHTIKTPPEDLVILSSMLVHYVTRMCDATFAKCIIAAKNIHSKVFFIGGFVHCIALNHMHGWPISALRDPLTQRDIDLVFKCFISAYYSPRHFDRAGFRLPGVSI